jgi:hypothetical protein
MYKYAVLFCSIILLINLYNKEFSFNKKTNEIKSIYEGEYDYYLRYIFYIFFIFIIVWTNLKLWNHI